MRNTVAHAQEDRPWKSQWPIRAAECFWPLSVLNGVDSVRKTQKYSPHAVHEHSISQFSRQPLTPFEPRFDFPDRLDSLKLMQRPKTFRRANQSLRFSWPVSSCMSNSNSHLSRQPHLLCNISFVVLDHNQILERSYSLTIFIRAIQVRQIWIGICSGNLHSWIFREPSTVTVWKFHLHNSVFPKDQNGM